MNKDSENLKLTYILSIFIMVVGLLWYIVSDIFSKAKLTLYPLILNRILIDLLIFWALFIILISFLIYLFVEGLRLTDNDYLRSLSKNPNEFYTLGFELSLIIIPLAIFLMLYNSINNITINIILAIILLFYFYKFVLPLRKSYYKISNLLIFISVYIFTFFLIFGVFQLITSDIKINFDRQYYHNSDYVIITIDQSGITYPHINAIKINGWTVKPENLYTSDEGTKQVVIYDINNVKESLVFRDNYNIMQVEVDYSIPFLWNSINTIKFASFIVLSNPLELRENQLNQSNGPIIGANYKNNIANTTNQSNKQSINSEFYKDSFSWVGTIASFGPLIAALIAYFTLREMKIQRELSDDPKIYVIPPEKNVLKVSSTKLDDVDTLLPIMWEGDAIENQISHFPPRFRIPIEIVNTGLGPALNVKLTLKYEHMKELLNYINKLGPNIKYGINENSWHEISIGDKIISIPPSSLTSNIEIPFVYPYTNIQNKMKIYISDYFLFFASIAIASVKMSEKGTEMLLFPSLIGIMEYSDLGGMSHKSEFKVDLNFGELTIKGNVEKSASVSIAVKMIQKRGYIANILSKIQPSLKNIFSII